MFPWSVNFIFLCVLCISFSLTNGEEGEVVCVKDDNLPKYLPNIYKCKEKEDCCMNEGEHACCGTEVTGDAVKEQLIMWGIVIGILLVVGIAASCYFTDRYCCDAKESDEDSGCCGMFSSNKNKYKKKKNMKDVLYPDEAKEKVVDDPIFGQSNNGQHNDVPQYATIDTRRVKHI